MKKIGIIPPHFLYYLENEGIDITDFRSSNFGSKDSYDKIIVKFPYSIKTVDIQVLFDNLDFSAPPDFVLVNDGEFVIKYQDIIKDWNFRESSSLYTSLNKIKECYSAEQEKRLKEQIKAVKEDDHVIHNINDEYPSSINSMIYDCIEKMIKYIKNRFENYKQIPKSGIFIDIVTNTNNKDNLSSTNANSNINSSVSLDKYANHIIISYPIDCLIRSRNINRAPIIHVFIPLAYDMKFYVDVKVPHFVGIQSLKFAQEYADLSTYAEYLTGFESIVLENFRYMQIREMVINKIIDSNIGFPLEIDTMNFLKLSLYFNHNKSSMSTPTSTSKNKQIITPSSSNQIVTAVVYNYILHFLFSTEDNTKLEFQIIDCDKLTIVLRKKIEYGPSDREVNNLLHIIIQALFECLQTKKNK